MAVETFYIDVVSEGKTELINITENIEECILKSNISNGIITVFCGGATGGITTIEYEPGLVNYDFDVALEKIAPKSGNYKHNDTWHDGNGNSHIRASVIGPDLTVPFNNKKLFLGTWQQIIFIEFDMKRRNRKLIVQIMGE